MVWPAVTLERLPWTPTIDVPRRWRSTYSGPYDAAVTPAIAELTLDLPGALAALATEASAEVAAFDAELGDRVSPSAALLLRAESASSSRIEQLTASAKAIALAELGDGSRRNAREIVANAAAMHAALDRAAHLDAAGILAIHAALLGDVDPGAGRWRTQQVWIGRSGYGPHTAEFVPPSHTRVPAAIDDLVAFMGRDDLPVLVQGALAHAQFETIHPFTDGNGRTGRALLHSLMRAKGLTARVTVPVSAGLLVSVDAYFDALGAYRGGDPLPIVERMCEAAFDAVGNGRQLVADLDRVRRGWEASLTARRQATVWSAIDVVIRRPVLDSALLQAELSVNAQAANAAIEQLVAIGALRQFTDGRRNRKFEARQVLDALDAFAERGGRRVPG